MEEGASSQSIALADHRQPENRSVYRALAGFFLVFWLLPISYVGLTEKQVPVVSNWFNEQYRVACLFTKRIPAWTVLHYQARWQGGWETLDIDTLCPLTPFGYRNRLDFILTHDVKGQAWEQRISDIAHFLTRRIETEFPERGRVRGIRFIQARIPSGDPLIARPMGHWERFPLEVLESYGLNRLAQFDWDAEAPPAKTSLP